MGVFELLILAVGLSMDAFAVSICKGLAMKRAGLKETLIVGLWFGGFQALMPLIGYFLGDAFEDYITKFDHWIAFVLLCLIGGLMLKDALSHEEEETDGSLSFKTMLLMAIATSIDALAVGISFGILPNVNIVAAISLIGIVTLVLCMVGVKLGNIFGARYKSKAELAGGIILILIGTKILLEHLGVINF